MKVDFIILTTHICGPCFGAFFSPMFAKIPTSALGTELNSFLADSTHIFTNSEQWQVDATAQV